MNDPGGARRLKILIADDEVFVTIATALTLEDRGHTVRTVADGIEALDAMRSYGPFDVLVTDVSMPRMDGRALVRELRNLHFHLPVVVVTGFSSIEMKADFATVGGTVVVMQKPVDFDRLAVEVERVTAAAGSHVD